MQQLHFVELDEDGRLVLSAEDGTRYAVPVDDRLRAALRPRPTSATPDRSSAAVTLREVQSMIRAGQTVEEVASFAGWEVDRVRRYEGPVLAEREHVIGLAQRAAVRAQGRTDGSHTLGPRVEERLQRRDVDLSGVTWDAARSTAHGPWTVQVIFTAGGRERRGAWHYDLHTRGLEALDDEARWLSEDEQALPGGLAGHPLLGSGHGEDEVAADLMATMRERRQRRSRRPRRATEPVGDPGQVTGHVPGQQAMPPEVLPLEDLAYDPDTMGDPPAAHPGGAAPESPAPLTDPSKDAAEGQTDQGIPADPTGEAADDGAAGDGAAADGAAGEEAVPEDGAADAGAAEPPARGGKAAPRKRPERGQRRRLRLPKLPDPVDPPITDEQDGHETYARLRDAGEVSFDEFFDLDETPDDGTPDDVTPDGPAAEDDDVRAETDETNQTDGTDETDDTVEQDASDVEQDASDDRDDSAVSVEEQDSDEDAAPTEETPAAEAEQEDNDRPAAADPEPTPRAKPAGRKGRPSVPSWDDIMFGARDRP